MASHFVKWPDSETGPLGISFDYAESSGSWKCTRIEIKPLCKGDGIGSSNVVRLTLPTLMRQGVARLHLRRLREGA